MLRLLLAAPVLALCGCSLFGPSSAYLVFETVGKTHVPGTLLEIRLVNGTGNTIHYNLCFVALERREAGWAAVPEGTAPSPKPVCTAQLDGLQPGQETKAVARLPHTLAPGTYRAVTEVERSGYWQRLVTPPFAVE